MKTPASRALFLGLIAVTSLYALPACAQKITSATVTDITLEGVPTRVDVVLKDMSGGTSVANVNIQPVTTTLQFPVTSTVKCAKSSGSNGYSHSQVGFGAFNPTFLDTLVVHQEMNPDAGHTVWTGTKWITEAAAPHLYQVALKDLKNPAKPSQQLDVLAEFNAAMNAFIQQGGTKLDYLKSNRTIDVARSVSVLGACWSGVSTKGFATYTKPVTVRISYQGNPNLSPVNAQLGQMGTGGIQVGAQPLKLTSGNLQPHAPHYVGACPVDLKFRVSLSGAGKGQVQYRITENSSTVYSSPQLPFAGGTLQHEFSTPIQYKGQASLNQKVAHTYTLHVRVKDETAAVWPAHYQNMGSAAWSHTCTPQVGVGLGGVGPGGQQLAPNAGGSPATPPKNVRIQPAPQQAPGVAPPAPSGAAAAAVPTRLNVSAQPVQRRQELQR